MSRHQQQVYSRNDDATWTEGKGIVTRLLRDDNEGSRHQRFILDMRNGQTLLIAHNIDIASRVPVGLGDRVHFRGMYEWNDLGGLIHWTHHDPQGVESGGYIRFKDEVFQ